MCTIFCPSAMHALISEYSSWCQSVQYLILLIFAVLCTSVMSVHVYHSQLFMSPVTIVVVWISQSHSWKGECVAAVGGGAESN